MATQTGSIDLTATNGVHLYAKGGFESAAESYATKSELSIEAGEILSTVSSTYATKQELDDLEIGGRNLLADTAELGSKWVKDTTSAVTVSNGVATATRQTSSSNARIYQMPANGYWTWTNGESYVASIEARSDTAGCRILINAVGAGQQKYFNATTSWQRYSFAFTATSASTGSMSFYNTGAAGDVVQFRKPKLERGDKATDWTPAPEDLESRVTQAETSIVQNAEAIILKANSSDVYTKEQADELVAGAVSKSASGERTVTTEDAAELPLLTLDVDGETVQDGTPTPSAPVYIQCVRGRNLLRNDGVNTTGGGVQFTVNPDGSITANGKPSGTSDAQYYIEFVADFSGNCTYSGCPSGGSGSTYDVYFWDMDANARAKKWNGTTNVDSDYGSGAEVKIVKGTTYHFNIRIKNSYTASNLTFRPMLEFGTASNEYVPYGKLAVKCSNGNTAYIDMTDPDTDKPVELYGLSDVYRDILSVDASGHVTVEKRCGTITIDDIDQVGTATTGIYYFAKDSLRIAPEPNNTTPTKAKSNMFAANQWQGNWYADKIFVNPSSPKPQFTHSNSSATTLSSVKTAFADFFAVYPMQESDWHTIDLGQVTLPTVSDDSIVHVAAEIQPVIAGSWWTETGASVGSLATRVTHAESSIEQNADNIALKVSTTDYNGTTVASLINQSADSVKIQADHVNIQGVITAINNDTSTTINGGKIATGSITANKIAIGDYNNYITATEKDPSTLLDGVVSDGWIYKDIAATTNIPLSQPMPNWTREGEKYRVTGTVKAPAAGCCLVVIYGRDASLVAISNRSVNFQIAANTETQVDGIIEVNAALAAEKFSNVAIVFCTTTSWTTNYQVGYCKEMRMERMSGGSLIVDGSITADKLAANSVTIGKLGVEVGGTNLLRSSENMGGWLSSNVSILNGVASASASGNTSNVNYLTSTWVGTGVLADYLGKTLTVSFEVYSDDWSAVTEGTSTGLNAMAFQLNAKTGAPYSGSGGASGRYLFAKLGNTTYFNPITPENGKWTRIVSKPLTLNSSLFTNDTSKVDGYDYLMAYFILIRRNGTVKMRHPKIEFGDVATGWSPAPEDLAATATNYITADSSGIKIHDAGDTSNYQHLTSSGTEIYQGGTSVASFGGSGARVGKLGAAHSIIDADGQRFYAANGSTQLANIGYGEGNANSGTSAEPYYTFGTRKTTATAYSTSSTYAVGDMCVYDSKVYVCILPVTIPGAWNSARWQLAIGNVSVAEGRNVIASGAWSHAEGFGTTAVNSFSHAEGNSTTANHGGHAEGSGTMASGAASHAEGYTTTASGTYSHAQNQYAKASKKAQTAIGTFNVEDNASYTTTHPSGSYDYGNYAFIVGNGTADDARSNAAALQWDGTLELAKALPVASGGTGATTAAAARTNLGLGALATKASASGSVNCSAVTATETYTKTYSVNANSNTTVTVTGLSKTNYTFVGFSEMRTGKVGVGINTWSRSGGDFSIYVHNTLSSNQTNLTLTLEARYVQTASLSRSVTVS